WLVHNQNGRLNRQPFCQQNLLLVSSTQKPGSLIKTRGSYSQSIDILADQIILSRVIYEWAPSQPSQSGAGNVGAYPGSKNQTHRFAILRNIGNPGVQSGLRLPENCFLSFQPDLPSIRWRRPKNTKRRLRS